MRTVYKITIRFPAQSPKTMDRTFIVDGDADVSHLAKIVEAGIREVYIDPARGDDVSDAPTRQEVDRQIEAEMLRAATAPAPARRTGAAEELEELEGLEELEALEEGEGTAAAEEAVEAGLDPEYVDAVLADQSGGDRPDNRIEAWAVTAAGRNGYASCH